MNEEVKQETADSSNSATITTKPKQYLIMADELHMALLGKLIPGLMYVQVEGMNMENNPDYMLLVNPAKKDVAIQPEAPKVD